MATIFRFREFRAAAVDRGQTIEANPGQVMRRRRGIAEIVAQYGGIGAPHYDASDFPGFNYAQIRAGLTTPALIK